MAPKQSNWDKLTAKLSPRTRQQAQESVTAASPLDNDDRSEFLTLQSSLSTKAQEALDARVDTGEPESWPEDVTPGWHLIESHDGEYPSTRPYKTVEAMIKRMRDLDGKDVCVFPFFGIAVPFSHGKPRIVFLPNQDAVRLDGYMLAEEVFEQDVRIQENGFLGPEELQKPAEDEDSDTVDVAFEVLDDDETA